MGLFSRRAQLPARPSVEERPAAEHQTPADRGASRLWSDGFGRVGTRSLQILALVAVNAVWKSVV